MDNELESQAFYAGQFRHSIDDKNRITIPSRWRRGKAAEFVLLPDPDGQFLNVMTPAEFARMSDSLANASQATARDRRTFLRHFHARAEHGAADKQGRLLLPDHLCQQLDLKGEVSFVGGRGLFEIWNLERWERAHQEQTVTYQHVATMIGL